MIRPLRRFFSRLFYWTNSKRDEERLRLEIEEHINLQTSENIRAGLTQPEARRRAVLKFGGVEGMRESYRDQRSLPFLEILLQDTRHALLRLGNAPAFTVATVVTLALGIGATTSIFTLVHEVLLKSLAVANPDELYKLGKESRCCYEGGYSQEREFSIVSYDLYKHFRDNTQGFAELAAFEAGEPMLGVRRQSGADPAQSYPGEFVSGNYFTMFGLRAAAGRTLLPADDQPGAPFAAMMSYRLWQQRYGYDVSVIGGVFNLDGKSFTVVGITPPGFFGDTLRNTPPDFFLPLNTEPFVEADADLNKINTHWLDLIGRIRPSVNAASVEAQMRLELKQWLRSHWGEMGDNERLLFPTQTLYLTPGGAGISTMRDAYERWLQILMSASALVLLIVCANVANLMLVRGMERRQQISLSMALGARSSRLVREALTESIVLSLSGGAVGLAVAVAGTRLILHFAFPSLSGMAGVPISSAPSIPVLLFTFAISLLTGIAFGIVPAWLATKVDPIEALRGANRSTTRAGSLPRKTLVVVQAALSLVLLSASGILTLALHNLENQNFGFDQNRRVVANIDPRLAGYRPERLTPLYQRIHDSIASLPGVAAVALCTYSPQNGNAWGTGVLVEGHPPPGPRDDNSAAWDRVTAGYFDVIGTPVIRGRGIGEQDTANSKPVAVISEAFAHKFFRNEDPIGKRFSRGERGTFREFEVVGIAKDARYLTLSMDRRMMPFFYYPEAQPDNQGDSTHFLHDIVVVTKPGAALSTAQLRQAIAAADPNLPVILIHSLKEQVAFVFTQQRLIARLTSLFGILSLILASIGLYGVTAYNASRRVNEIGVRMALGADRRDVIQLILRGAFALIIIGLAIGLPFTFVSGRVLSDQLYGTSPYNLTVIFVACAALGLSALVASLIPALRASHISPLEALRAE